jgi:hypothetical protein
MGRDKLAPYSEPECPGLASALCTESYHFEIAIVAFPPQDARAHRPKGDPSHMDRDQLASYSEPQFSGLASTLCTESCSSGVYAGVAAVEPMPA